MSDLSEAALVPAAEPGGPPAREPEAIIEHPGKLLRIAHMVRTMLDEVRTVELDEAGRETMAQVHERVIESLSEVVSDDLKAELAQVLPDISGDVPTGSELRIVQAQLAGWLEGLFRGIQASVVTQQMMAQQQVEQLRREQMRSGPPVPGSGAGQYL